jgi:hypothetical protein
MKEVGAQLMYCSNSYKLECESISKAKKFEILHNISLTLKIFALLGIIAIIWRLWFIAISIIFYILSIIISKKAFSMVFTYEYWLDDDTLKITRYYKNNTSKILVNLPIESSFLCEIVPYHEIDFNSKNCYVDKAYNSELYLSITAPSVQFYMIADKYFYSLLMEKK